MNKDQSKIGNTKSKFKRFGVAPELNFTVKNKNKIIQIYTALV